VSLAEQDTRAVTVAAPRPFWLQRSVRVVFFLVIALTIAGLGVAFEVPISVFPETSFPRVVIGVDNGVMPVEQMQVTITKPIEDAVNSVPGLETVRSTTSRGSAEVSLFFDWHQDMFRTLQLVDAALATVQQTLPATAKINTHRLTFATFPILGYSLTSDTVPQTRLWELATYDLKPSLNRVPGVSTVLVQGGQVPEFHVVPNLARLQASGVTVLDLANAIQASNIIDSPGLYEANHSLVLGLVGAQAHDAAGLGALVVKTTAGGGGAGDRARVHHGDRRRQARGALEHHAAAHRQHRERRQRHRGRDGPAAQQAATRRPRGAVLRPVAAGAREHRERARRHSHRPGAGRAGAAGLPA
jgi:multidrug efflux pump subunit AcrB